MRLWAGALAAVLIACGTAPAAVAPSASPSAAATANPVASGSYAGEGSESPTCPLGTVAVYVKELPPRGGEMCLLPDNAQRALPENPDQPAVFVQPASVPMPEVALRANAFTWTAAPALRRDANADIPLSILQVFGDDLMRLLDGLRGGGSRIGPVSREELNAHVWPGPFQEVVRAVAAAKPPQGRFFHLETARVDAVYLLPWREGDYQLMDATITFRDHAEYPPAEGELWYTWHLRLPMTGTSVWAVADGYDDSAPGLMRRDPYWTRTHLEQEATSAVAGYLWSESFLARAPEPFSRESPTTPFWKERLSALDRLRMMFRDGSLTERRFENVAVRIDRFEPLTVFGAGVVTVTVNARLVEVLHGKTYAQTFSAPLKFFRFGNGGASISGWAAVDAFEDGAWVSGGDLSLATLQTTFG